MRSQDGIEQKDCEKHDGGEQRRAKCFIAGQVKKKKKGEERRTIQLQALLVNIHADPNVLKLRSGGLILRPAGHNEIVEHLGYVGTLWIRDRRPLSVTHRALNLLVA